MGSNNNINRKSTMNILNIQLASNLKKAFNAGLVISGVEEGQIQWIGDSVQWSNYNE
jgi:hypothetical protein